MATVTPIEPISEAEAPAERTRKPKKEGKHPGGRPRAGTPPNPEREQRFFDKVKAVPQEDWGQRAFMYVYATEPLCNLKTQGGAKFLFKSEGPITDLQKIMADYGSFKGYMTLNIRKPGDKQGDQVDRFDFEIYNHNYPPKIPRKVWIDDSRNEKWAALLPPEPTAAPAQPSQPTFVETARLLQEIRRDAREEALESQPMQLEPPDPVEQMKGVAGILKELKGDAPKDTGMADVLKMMEANAARMHADLLAARAESATLNLRLIDAMKPQPAQESEITKLIVKKFVEDKIEGKETPAEVPERRGRVTAMDIVHDVAVALPNSPIMANIGNAFQMWMQMKMMEQQAKLQGQRPQQSQQTRHQPAALPGPGVPEPPQEQMQAQPQSQPQPQGAPPAMMNFTPQQLAEFLPQIIGPVCNTMEQGKDGYALAEWFQTQFGEMYYNILRNQGKEKIFAAIQMSPYWGPFNVNGRQHVGFAALEPQLKNMIEEFCGWPPPDDESEEEDDDPADEPEVL